MIYIVVPVFHRLKLSIEFYKSVSSTMENYRIIFVDDAPNSDEYDYFNNTQYVSVIKTSGDLWWCGSVNFGLKYVESLKPNDDDVLIIANNDVTLSETCWDNLKYHVVDDVLVHPVTNSSGKQVSSGAIIRSWFPYITKHPLNEDLQVDLTRIDLCTARFLCMKISTFFKIGPISSELIQYQGDNELSLRAKGMGINTFIVRDAICNLYNEDTGQKDFNLKSIKSLVSSFFSLRSPNNLKYRYIFVRHNFGVIFSCFIVFSMTLNSLTKYFFSKLKNI